MDKAIKSFISSTFWTERSGYVAGLKTIEFMEKYQTYKILKKWQLSNFSMGKII